MRDQYKREEKVSVLRNGEITSISCEDLVVGDICLLNYGDILPADGFCLVSNGLILDESALTGECDQLVKDRDNNFILLSRNIFLYSRIQTFSKATDVVDGCGKMIVTAVGLDSHYGSICMSMGLLSNSFEKRYVLEYSIT